MDWKALGQGILSNLVSATLIAGGAALLAILSATHSHWANPTLYGLAGASLVSVLLWSMTGRPPFSKQHPETTTENVESNIRMWLDYFGYGVQKVTQAEAHFAFVITPKSGLGMYAAQLKGRERYLCFGSNIDIAAEHQGILKALSKEKSGRIGEELALELAKTGVGYNLALAPDGTLTRISLIRNTPITANLTQDTFIAYVDQMESNAHVAREAIRLALDDARQQLPAARVNPQDPEQK